MLPRKCHEHEKPPQIPPKTTPNPTQNRPKSHPKPPITPAGGSAPRSMRRVPVGLFPPPLPSGLARRSSPSFPHGGAGFPPWVAPSGFPLFPPFGSGALASGSALCARVPVAFVRSRGLDLARPGRRPRLDAGDSGGERLPESPAEICCSAFYIPSPYPAPLGVVFFGVSLQPSALPRAFLRLGFCLAAGS